MARKREGAGKGSAKTGEEKELTKGKDKDPVRAEAARLMWAKRKASGTNGRYGGRPTERTVAKAKKREKEGGL